MLKILSFVAAAAFISLIGICALPAIGAAADDDITKCDSYVPDALEACTRVIALPSSTSVQVGDAYEARAEHYYKRKEYDRTIEDSNQALKFNPRYPQLAYSNRGNAYSSKGEDKLALDSYDKAIAIDPKYSSAYAARGLLYEKAGSIERARAEYSAALKVKSVFSDNEWAYDTARKHLEMLKDK